MAREGWGFGLSDQGLRKSNEDAFVCAEELRLFVVADGMGGHNAGEVASSLAVDAIVGFITRSVNGDDYSWPYGIDPVISFDGNRLRTAIKLANRRVFRAAEEHDDYTGMGTTVVAALITRDTVIVGHVGDSRLYVLANDELRQITADDSWAATMLVHEAGDDKASLAAHPMRNVLTNVLGARDQVEIHLQELPRQRGDLLLLCSDGLHGPLENETIARLVAGNAALPVMAQRLVDAALEQGSRDNVTVVLVDCDGVAQ
jgi:serine/threonine protein phosphatase PrpC